MLNRLRGRLGLRTLTFLFRRRLALFFTILATIVLVALLVAASSQPLFRASAEVLLDGPSVERETARLQSPALARLVAARLRIVDRAALAPCGGLMRQLWSRRSKSAQLPGRPEIRPEIVDCLVANLSVTHTPETLSLTISYSAADAVVAAQVANAFAAAYTGGTNDPGGGGLNGRIISSAGKPLSSSSPGAASALLIGLVLGALVGLAAALATELGFPGLTTGADVQTRLWVRHIGSIPALASALPRARSVLDAVIDHPQSAFAESFRRIITAARGAGPSRAHVIAIACAMPGEGATTVAIAMARTRGLGKQTVVLVDCDIRRRISTMFGVDARSAGLADVLAGRSTLDKALFYDAVSGAAVLPEATFPAGQRDLTGPAMRALVQQLRSRFDLVLLAHGPVVVGKDVRWLAALADAVLLVTRWRSTADTAVSVVLQELRNLQANIAGVVLNQVDMRRQVRYTDDEASVYQQQFSKYFS